MSSRLFSLAVISTAVLVHLKWDPNWVGAIGQWAGAIATFMAVVVALWLPRRERRGKQMEQARLVTIAVDYSDYEHPYDMEYPMARVVITNLGEQRLLRPDVERIRGAQSPVRWGREGPALEGEPYYSPPEVLMPLASHVVPFEHIRADGRVVDPAKAWDVYKAVQEIDAAGKNRFVSKLAVAGEIKKSVDVDDVTITFIDQSGLRWRRAGNGKPRQWRRTRGRQPVRVVQPASADKHSSELTSMTEKIR